MFSLGMEPSTTSTNGASSSPAAAARNGARNSSPPSVGESTLLWRWTLGRPGMAPRTTSSKPGWPAAVTDTESPSQLIPSEIQRMWTSSTPCFSSTAISPSTRCLKQLGGLCLYLERVDQQFLAGLDFQINPVAARALEREHRQLRHRAAFP